MPSQWRDNKNPIPQTGVSGDSFGEEKESGAAKVLESASLSKNFMLSLPKIKWEQWFSKPLFSRRCWRFRAKQWLK